MPSEGSAALCIGALSKWTVICLSLSHLESVWIADCGKRVEDFLGLITTVHLLILGQKSHDECPDTVKERSEYLLWPMT